jgi:hypothetical protein
MDIAFIPFLASQHCISLESFSSQADSLYLHMVPCGGGQLLHLNTVPISLLGYQTHSIPIFEAPQANGFFDQVDSDF